MENQFKVGDVVILKSGGPRMTVNNVSENGIECIWIEGSYHRATFNSEVLEKYRATGVR